LPDAPAQLSPKAARILTATSELLLARGFRGVTIAEVAQRAHVGKGTVYLYWKTKDDLVLDLVTRALVGFAESLIEQLASSPERARPSLFCSDVIRRSSEAPLLVAHGDRDDDLLGAMTRDPRVIELQDTLGPIAILHAVVPPWRRAGLARTDHSVTEQAMALHMLTSGAAIELSQPRTGLADHDIVSIYARAVTALLGPEERSDEDVRAAALDIVEEIGRLLSRTNQRAALRIPMERDRRPSDAETVTRRRSP